MCSFWFWKEFPSRPYQCFMTSHFGNSYWGSQISISNHFEQHLWLLMTTLLTECVCFGNSNPNPRATTNVWPASRHTVTPVCWGKVSAIALREKSRCSYFKAAAQTNDGIRSWSPSWSLCWTASNRRITSAVYSSLKLNSSEQWWRMSLILSDSLRACLNLLFEYNIYLTAAL